MDAALRDPDIPDGERTTYRGSIRGNQVASGTLVVEGCAIGLRGLDFEKGARRTISLWLANSVHWEIELRVEKLESVNGVEAWRVRARPSFEAVAKQLDRIIGIFLPPFVLHFEREPPHGFIRFEFPTGPFPWNPRGLIEAVADEPAN